MSTAAVLFLVSSLVVAASPQAAIDAHKEGMRLAKANQAAAAIEQLEKAVKLDPQFAEAWADLGNTQLSSGSMDEAINAFAQAVRIRGDFQVARYNLAYALRKSNQHAKAAEQYRIYLQREPEDADAWYGLAESLRQSGEPAPAAEAYEKYAVVEKRPAQTKWVKKAEEQARALRAATGTEPATRPGKKEPTVVASNAPVPAKQKPAVAANTGSKHVSFSAKAKKEEVVEASPVLMGSSDLAKPDLAPEAPAAPAKRPESFNTALTALKSGDYEGALKPLESAAKAAPEDAMVLAALGSAHLGMRHGEEAELAYRQALKTAQPAAVPGIWLGIGEANRMQGEPAKARDAYEQIAKDDAASPAVKAAAKERAEALR